MKNINKIKDKIDDSDTILLSTYFKDIDHNFKVLLNKINEISTIVNEMNGFDEKEGEESVE